MSITSHKISRLKQLAELSADRQSIMLGKHRLLAEINRRQETRRASALNLREQLTLTYLKTFRKFIPQRQFVIAAFLIVVLTTSTSVMAQAAVPGDVLWPIKLTLEKAEVTFATNSEQEGRVHIRHVDNRLHELTSLIAQPDTRAKNANISQLVRRLEKDITAASQSLKITKDEKEKSEPQVIMALAKDLSAKATEAVKALEKNKNELGDDVITASDVNAITGITAATSTELITTGDLVKSGSATNTAQAVASLVTAPPTPRADLKQIITEVQIVNEYISYNALEAMIEMVEKRGSNNRPEVTGVLNSRIDEQRQRLSALQEAVPLVSDNFILHRNQAKGIVKKANALLDEATTMSTLDNLSAALGKLTDGKDLISQVAVILQEVSIANGLLPRPEVLPVAKPVAKPVTIQTTTATSTDETNEAVIRGFNNE